ncbi:endolysin [Mycobacterium phage FF47]|uniref:Tail length tape measure protein n=1 Tax=Mycobacterium phage FF47 TaxID=1305710 RepID=M4WNM2_9CAUD|nr:endolysin [Mycobacterium phage FF47]AGI12287.1 tail length tape measure protein [Mycobacterium phage FF47]
MTSAGVELAAEWVTILPETAALVKELKNFEPPPITVPVKLESASAVKGGKQAGREIRTGIVTETKQAGKEAGDAIVSGVASSQGKVSTAATNAGEGIRKGVVTKAKQAGQEAGDAVADEVKKKSPKAEAAGSTFGSKLIGGLKKTALVGAAGIATIFTGAIAKGFTRLKDIDNARSTLQGLGHDAESVTKIMDSALAAVKGTAFGLGDAATVAASAVAAGVKPGEELTRTLSLVADAAAIAKTDMASMGAIFNKAATTNKVQGEIMQQLGERGIPIVKLLADEIGVTTAEIAKMSADGKIDFATFQNAMEKGMGGAAKNMGNSFTGAVSNIGAALGRLGATILTPLFNKVIEWAPKVIEWLDKVEEQVKPMFERLSAGFKTFMEALSTSGQFIKDNATQFKIAAAVITTLFLPGIAAAAAHYARLAIAKTVLTAITAATKIATAAQWLWNASLLANPLGLIIAAIAAVVAALVLFFTKTELGQKIWQTVWGAIKTATQAVVSWFTTTAWPALQNAFKAIGQALMWLYQNVWQPAWDVIKTVAQVVWAVLEVIFAAFGAALRVLGGVIEWWWNNVTVPAFNAVKKVIEVVWNFVRPIWDLWKAAFDKLVEGMTKFKDIFVTGFEAIKKVFGSVWDWIKPKLEWLIDKFNSVRDTLNNFNPFGNSGGGTVPSVPGFAGGHPAGRTSSGRLYGPGTGTSDSIFGVNEFGIPVVRVSAGEGIVRADVMQRGGADIVAALNSGILTKQLPGYAKGLSPGATYLSSMIKKVWPVVTDIGGIRAEDGYGEHSSGNALDIMIPNYGSAQGQAIGNEIAATLINNAEKIGLDGLIWQQKSYGYGGSITSGKPMPDRGSDTQNHMDHIHMILGKGRGVNAAPVGLPSSALSVSSAASSAGSAIRGGSSGSSSGGYYEVDPKKVRAAENKVTDKEAALAVAEQRLSEVEKQENVKQSTLQAARDRVEKLKRETEQARADLEEARQGKYKEGSKKAGQAAGESSGLDGKELGKMFVGGILESFGFDGSLFDNLFESPNVKSAIAGVNAFAPVISNLLGGGSSDGFMGVGSGDPTGGLIAGVGDAFGVNAFDQQSLGTAQGDQSALGDGSPVVDMRGAQLGWDPQQTMDKVEQFSASKRRFTNLPGPGA